MMQRHGRRWRSACRQASEASRTRCSLPRCCNPTLFFHLRVACRRKPAWLQWNTHGTLSRIPCLIMTMLSPISVLTMISIFGKHTQIKTPRSCFHQLNLDKKTRTLESPSTCQTRQQDDTTRSPGCSIPNPPDLTPTPEVGETTQEWETLAHITCHGCCPHVRPDFAQQTSENPNMLPSPTGCKGRKRAQESQSR